jgi:hypothetical protein
MTDETQWHPEIGDLVKIILTGEIGMVIDAFLNTDSKGFRRGYLVRTPDYRTIKFYETELMPVPVEGE